ncbi:phage terminase large subunit [Sebaldella termitidis]|uniref:Phage uncharacterized protein n=1 Tax=Sebaldella termitidis (strain ATCC 33386 / NCTC 11300) TaxID=526218 RepID=D1AN81_SEBTE|nr:phage terminase large subunit [Sebaldella termitidis]ACZ09685.1 phage uncharacterized protein [Sebaldella termitidis ATCC 33386]
MKALNRFLELNNLEILNKERYEKFLEIKNIEKYIENLEINKLKVEEMKEIITLNKYLITESYYSYFKNTFPNSNPLIRGRHIELICDILTLASLGVIKTDKRRFKMIINMPPRHLKSTSITNTFPSWFVLKTQKPVILGAYGKDLAAKAGARNKDLYIEYKKYFGNIDLKVKGSTTWETEKAARVISTPLQGRMTGEGSSLLIIDDPVKNRLEANSKRYRDRLWETWKDDASTRINPGEVMIALVVMTRWHYDDLAGRLKEDESEKFAELILAAECENEETDILLRKKGELLWEEGGFDEAFYEPYKSNPRTWASLFQQRPTPEEGDYFHREDFKYFKEDNHFYYLYNDGNTKTILKRDCVRFFTVDTAMKEKDENDETAIFHWALTPDKELLLLNIYHNRLKIPDQERILRNQILNLSPDTTYIEDKQSGTYLIQKFKEEGFLIEELQAQGDKVFRASSIINLYGNRRVYHRLHKEDPEVEAYERQLLEFPNGTHDDMVDCASYAGIVIRDKYTASNHFLL